MFSTSTPTSAAAVSPVVKQGGAGFFQRLTSFVSGLGVATIISQYFIYKELVDGNASILKKQSAIEKRLSALEK